MEDRSGRTLLLRASAAVRTIGLPLALVAALAAFLGSCGSPWKKGEPWSFALTRDILDREGNGGNRQERPRVHNPSVSKFHGGVEELWVLAVFFIPTAVDIALVPLTGVHDLYVE